MLAWFYVYGFMAWLLAIACAAWRYGRQPERIVAWSFTAGVLLSIVVRSPAATKYVNLEMGVTAIDMAFLAVLVVVALRSDRWWPLCAAALQTITVAGHLAKMLDPGMPRMAYALMIGVPSYPLLLTLTIGLWNNRRNAWRISSRSYGPVDRPTRTEQPPR